LKIKIEAILAVKSDLSEVAFYADEETCFVSVEDGS